MIILGPLGNPGRAPRFKVLAPRRARLWCLGGGSVSPLAPILGLRLSWPSGREALPKPKGGIPRSTPEKEGEKEGTSFPESPLPEDTFLGGPNMSSAE